MSAEEKWQCILLWDEIYECYETLRRKNMENNAPDSSLRALLSLALQQFPHLTPLQRRWIEWHVSQFLLAFPKATLNLLKYTVLQLTHSD